MYRRIDRPAVTEMLLTSMSAIEIAKKLGYEKQTGSGQMAITRLIKSLGFKNRVELMSKEIERLRGVK